jgi:hypothetical protein
LSRAGNGVLRPTGCHVGVDLALLQPGKIGLRAIARVRRRLSGLAAEVGLRKALLGGGHADRLKGDDLRDGLELLGRVVHLRDALCEALLVVSHR